MGWGTSLCKSRRWETAQLLGTQAELLVAGVEVWRKVAPISCWLSLMWLPLRPFHSSHLAALLFPEPSGTLQPQDLCCSCSLCLQHSCSKYLLANSSASCRCVFTSHLLNETLQAATYYYILPPLSTNLLPPPLISLFSIVLVTF